MGAAAGGGACADDERPHLAALPHRRREDGAFRSPRCRASTGSASTRRCARPSGRSSSTSRRSRSFPTPSLHLKDERGSEAFNDGNLVCRACRAIKREFPQLGLVTDVALDPYTSHGHDGLVRESATGELTHSQRRDGRGAGAPGAQPGARRRRRHRALRHDGRAGRRDPRGARRRRLPRRADHGLRGQIRLRLLRTVPRRARLGRRAQRRQAHLSDGPGQQRRGACARSSSTSTRAPTW